MVDINQGPYQDGSNDSGTDDDHEQRAYQLAGDYVISSSRAPGAWVSATHPIDPTEVA